MNAEALAEALGYQGLIAFILGVVLLIVGGITAEDGESKVGMFVFLSGVILFLGAFILWSVSIWMRAFA